MTAFQEPLEQGWLRTVLRDVREEVNSWSDEHERSRSETADETVIKRQTYEAKPPR